jgi:hypothetical protein
MASNPPIEVRPRTTGEILDDAWRLCLAEAPVLAALTGLFDVPAAAVLLMLLVNTELVQNQLLLPALAAALLLLTGLGSGAAQAALRRRAESKPAALGACLGLAWRRGLDHVAARCFLLAGTLVGTLCLVMPGLAVWVGSAAVQPILAAEPGGFLAAFRAARREAQQQPGKTAVVVLSRLVVLGFGVVNLHALVHVGLWVAEHSAGLDMALTAALLTWDNPVYVVALGLLVWIGSAPYAEACHFLLHVDARARYEGLDLWYQVQRFFPAPDKDRLSSGLVLLVGALFTVGPALAAEGSLSAVQEVRQQLRAIIQEVAATDRYASGDHWAPRLNELADRLDRAGGAEQDRYRWFRRPLDGFAQRPREDALRVLESLERRLALVEENRTLRSREAAWQNLPKPGLTKEQIKALLPPERLGQQGPEADPPDTDRRPLGRKRTDEPKVPAPPQRDRQAPGMLAPQPVGGFDALGWMVLAGLLVAVLVAAGLLGWQRRPKQQPARTSRPTRPGTVAIENLVVEVQPHTVLALWRQADELATAGDFQEAVRVLYLAVLAILHQGNLIRFERTRTNGEYVQQLRARGAALAESFQHLTTLFEGKWYNESACRPSDFAHCRNLADQIRAGSLLQQDAEERGFSGWAQI